MPIAVALAAIFIQSAIIWGLNATVANLRRSYRAIGLPISRA